MILKKILPLILMSMLWAGILGISASAEQKTALVSPALEMISMRSGIAKASVGKDIGFEASDFERALNVSRLSAITVTSLPNRSDGVLYLGGSEVREGQTIARANLSFLTFSFMSEDIKNSTFCFSTNLGDYNVKCSVYSLAYENERPVISSVDHAAVAVGTYQNISVFGEMEAYDPDGDTMTFEIVEYPQNGILKVTNAATGAYQYVPNSGYVGKDDFRYVAVDKYGNYSASSKVTLTVARSNQQLVYNDLEDSAAHVAAIALTDKGIMACSKLNGEYYFHPTATVTRAEFLTMAMKTVGIEDLSGHNTTVFADDAEIPEKYRGYVDTAQKLGFVCGRICENGELIFAPNEAITRAEAATVLYNMVSLDLPVFKPLIMDTDSVPAWASDAVHATVSAGILTGKDGYISASSPVTREQCAEILYKLDTRENS